MFPLNSNMPYIKDNGERDKLGNVIGSGGGGGGSFTPDYENEVLIVGTSGDYEFYIPMSKRYVGDGIPGYEIKTNPGSTQSLAKIDLYSVVYDDGQITDSELIKTLDHKTENTYTDGTISISYSNLKWSVSFSDPLYDTSGDAYTSPLSWNFDSTVDYVMLTEDPDA